tara:strand:- start:2497 stop:3279 length:783 start_codon:yes stop_codon:yes gene_type:complete
LIKLFQSLIKNIYKVKIYIYLMQLFLIVDSKTNVIRFEKDEEQSYENLIKKVEDKVNYNRNFFWLKMDCKVLNENLKENIFFRNETTIDLSWRHILSQRLYTNDKLDKFYNIPNIVLKESDLIINLIDPLHECDIKKIELTDMFNDENKLIFNSTNIIKKSNINSWINLSFYISEFLSNLKKTNRQLEIERPLTNKDFSIYIGKKANDYLENLSLDSLKEIACLADYLDIKYLLETVCAFIANKFVKNKTLEYIKNMDLI